MTDPVLIHAANAKKAGAKWGVDPAVILGLLSVEGGTSSSGKPVAPHDGAGPPSYGQFTYATGSSYGVKFGDSASETDAIGHYLHDLGYSSDPRTAIAKYNGGPGNPQYSYADKVLSAAKRYGAGAITGTSAPAPSAGAQPTVAATQGSDLFADKASGLKYASTWLVVLLAGLAVAAIGVNRSFGGTPARAAKTAAKRGAVAAAV